jgi:hypothetical protein
MKDKLLESNLQRQYPNRMEGVLIDFERGLEALDYEIRTEIHRGNQQKADRIGELANNIRYAITDYRREAPKN